MRPSLVVFIFICALTSACGWQLRGLQADSKLLPNIQVVSKDNYSALARSVREVIQKQDGSAGSDTTYKLQILEELVEKRPVTYHANGTPAQYEMTITVNYVIQPGEALEPSMPRQTASHRIFDFDPRNVVAKSEEERALLQQMRQQIAQRLISEISREHSSRTSSAVSADTP